MVLAPLAGLVAALMAALLAIAADLLVRAVASQLPNLSILGVGLNLARIFRNAADSVVNWAIGNLDTLFDALTTWFVAHIMVLDQFFGATVSAALHLGDQIAHIVNVSIPNGIRAAEAAAGANAARLFNTAERDITTVGDRVDTIVTRTIPHALHTAETYTDSAITTLHKAITHEIDIAKAAVEADLTNAKTDLTRSISSLANTVASDFAQAKQIAQQDATVALNAAKDLIAQAKAEAENVAAADAAKVQDLLQRAIDATNSTVDRLTGTVAQDLTAAEQYAQQQVAQGVQAVTDQLTTTATQLRSAITAGANAAQAGIASDLATAQADAGAAINTAESAIGGALGDIYTDITGRALSYNGDLTQVAGAVGLAITGAIAGVTARVTHLEECSVGVCADSPNNFSSLLKDALGIAEYAGVGAFLAELINDPAAAEQRYAGLVSGAYAGGQSAFDTLLSL